MDTNHIKRLEDAGRRNADAHATLMLILEGAPETDVLIRCIERLVEHNNSLSDIAARAVERAPGPHVIIQPVD